MSGIASSTLGINTSNRNEVARDLVILPDGRIALTGAATQASGLNAMFVGLLSTAGAADTLFRANGFLTQTSPASTGLAIAWNASASRIVAVGSAIFSGTTERPYVIDTAVLSTGSTDAGYVNPGTGTASVAWGVATNPGGRTHYGIASLTSSLWSPMTSRSSGITVDTSFGVGGFFSFPPSGSSDLVRDASAVGTTMYLVGTRENGIDDNAFIATRSLDGTSSAFSQVVWDFGADNTDDGWFAVAGNASGIFAAGSTDNGSDENLLIVALNTDGSTRTAFGTAGVFTLDLGDTDRVEDIAVDGSGRLIIVGRSSQGGVDRAFVARVTAAGALDTTYGTGGVTYLFGATVESEAFGVAIDASGKAVVVGSIVSASGTDDVFVARLN